MTIGVKKITLPNSKKAMLAVTEIPLIWRKTPNKQSSFPTCFENRPL